MIAAHGRRRALGDRDAGGDRGQRAGDRGLQVAALGQQDGHRQRRRSSSAADRQHAVRSRAAHALEDRCPTWPRADRNPAPRRRASPARAIPVSSSGMTRDRPLSSGISPLRPTTRRPRSDEHRRIVHMTASRRRRPQCSTRLSTSPPVTAATVAAVSGAGLTRRYGDGDAAVDALCGVDIDRSARRVRRRHGAVRLRQVHPHAPARRARRPDAGHGAHRRGGPRGTLR